MTVSAEIPTDALLGLERLERQINNAVVPRPPRAAVRPLSPMPDHVEHRNGVNEVGKLSAEAVVREYQAAVNEIEALGTELQEAAKKCEAMVAGVHATVSEIKELAANYREEGKRYFLQIEDCSLMTSEVRSVCETLKKKIAAGSLAA